MKRPGIAAVLWLALMAGCAAFAGKADYADYRAVRMAPDEQERLLAMRRYVKLHPSGRYFREIQDERERREPETFESSKSDRSALEQFLRFFPDGRFAGEARTRLDAMRQLEARRAGEGHKARELVLERRRWLAGQHRTWMSRFTGFWVRTLAEIGSWGERLPEVARLNPVFSRAFGAQPRPRCSRNECVKSYRALYAVPQPGGTRVEREARLLLRLRMKDGALQSAELLLPDRGFSRWYELENQRVVIDEDEADRTRAVKWCAARLRAILQQTDPGLSLAERFELEAVSAPAVKPGNELADTSRETPLQAATAPESERTKVGGPRPGAVALAESADGGDGDDRTVPELERMRFEALIAPEKEVAPDMVMEALEIPPEGRAPAVASQSPAPDLVMDTLDVTGGEGDGFGPPGEPEPGPGEPGNLEADSPAGAGAYLIDAFELRSLRVALFASGPGPGWPAYDGLVFERRARSPKEPARER